MKRIVTTTEAALLCEVDPVTVRSWVARGYLKPLGKRGRELAFEVADVWRVEVATNQRDRTGRAER